MIALLLDKEEEGKERENKENVGERNDQSEEECR